MLQRIKENLAGLFIAAFVIGFAISLVALILGALGLVLGELSALAGLAYGARLMDAISSSALGKAPMHFSGMVAVLFGAVFAIAIMPFVFAAALTILLSPSAIVGTLREWGDRGKRIEFRGMTFSEWELTGGSMPSHGKGGK